MIFIAWIAFILLEKNKLDSYKKVCKNKDFCNAVGPSEYIKILDFNQNQKSGKPMENVRKNRDINFATHAALNNSLVLGPNYQQQNFFRKSINDRN